MLLLVLFWMNFKVKMLTWQITIETHDTKTNQNCCMIVFVCENLLMLSLLKDKIVTLNYTGLRFEGCMHLLLSVIKEQKSKFSDVENYQEKEFC